MKLSKGGVISAGVYLVFVALMTVLFLRSGDHMYFALAILPALITCLFFLIPTDWPGAGYALLVLCLLISYFFGWFIDAVVRGLYRLSQYLYRMLWQRMQLKGRSD